MAERLLHAQPDEHSWSEMSDITLGCAGICGAGEFGRSRVPLHLEEEKVEETITSSSHAATLPGTTSGDHDMSVVSGASPECLSTASISRIQRTRHHMYERADFRLLIGATGLGLLALLFFLDPTSMEYIFGPTMHLSNSPHTRTIRGEPLHTGVLSYIELFPKREFKSSARRNLIDSPPSTMAGTSTSSSTSSLSGGSSYSGAYKGAQLVIAGKMTVEDAPCNIAQFNFKTQEWSLTERIQLSLYNSYSGGEVYSLLANHTNRPDTESTPDSWSSNRSVRKLGCGSHHHRHSMKH